jgi:hypothetical protein
LENWKTTLGSWGTKPKTGRVTALNKSQLTLSQGMMKKEVLADDDE